MPTDRIGRAAVFLSLVIPQPAFAAIEPVPTAITGFVGLAARGDFDTPISIRSPGEFDSFFGGHDPSLPNPHLAPSVSAFFANGGEICHVVRVPDAGDEAFIGAADAGGGGTGLQALRAIDEIAVVCIPGNTSPPVQAALIAHCEEMGDRMCILDPEAGADAGAVVRQREGLVSERGYAALYYPWMRVSGEGGEALVPPSGFVAGVYARTDREQGVWKAPVGEVLGAAGVERAVTEGEQGVLNDAGISTLRLFAGRGILVWGARTIAPGNEWKYVSIRRLLLYLEESIHDGTSWAVFEGNDEPLWARLRMTVEDFLLGAWRDGALQGATPDEAFLVKIDRSTMTQGDMDAGRTVILIDVAPIQPAEFLLLRIVHERGAPEPTFARGDVSPDGVLDISDPVAVLAYLFLGAGAPGCLASADFNDSGAVDLSDAVYGLGFLFLGGPPPPPPFGECGADPTPGGLSCSPGGPCG